MPPERTRVGLTLPQGCDREFRGLDPAEAWRRTLGVARQAEEAGFESVWLYDHFQVDPPPERFVVFEPFVELTAIAMATTRVRLGHLVLAAAYRPAALTASMLNTLDVVSGGRVELGIGAGWKEDEWRSYGYGFPDARTRLAILEDHLEVIARLLEDGGGTYAGAHAAIDDAILVPSGLQGRRPPIMVGGNGPNRTWRIAARFADELNLDALTPIQVAQALPVIADRCAEIGRDPATLRVSVHVWGEAGAVSPGSERCERLLAYAELGLARVIVQGFQGVLEPATLRSLIDDCSAAGLLDP
jgi:alkanesulfonate monooxygenase SsuD/methylene tetrahydromethanopterin reductase-like flavin-dependent oxidoreductase (luciferase family)